MSHFSPVAREWISRSILVFAAISTLLVVRARTASRIEFQQAELFFHHGDVDNAIIHYRNAARFYAPLNEPAQASVAALERIGATAEVANDPAHALKAWRAIHAASLGARSFFVPYGAALAVADAHIAELTAHEHIVAKEIGKSLEARVQLHARELDGYSLVRERAADMALFGFLAFAFGLFGFAHLGFEEGTRVVWSKARPWALCAAIGWSVWLLGLVLA